MSKTKKERYAKNGALIFGLGNGLANLAKQLDAMEQNPETAFDLWELVGATLKGGAVGAMGGYLLGWYRDKENDEVIPLDADSALKDIANQSKLDKRDPVYKALLNSATQLIKALKQEYNTKLQGNPVFFGSTQKGTALKISYDKDVGLNFKSNSFSSTGAMLDDLYHFLSTQIGRYGITAIRRQSKSIGLFLDIKGQEVMIDVVPVKLTKGSKTSGYLHVNKKNFFIDRSTIKKTDLSLLRRNKLGSVQKDIVVLLKKWRNQNGLRLSSHLLEYLVTEAYKQNRYTIPRKLSGKLVMTIEFISENLNCIRIKGIENTNNIITDFDEEEKLKVMSACKKVIEAYAYQPNSIIEAFED